MDASAPDIDVDAVTRLVRAVARDVVVPKFRSLRGDEILSKETPGHADDVVTVVDGAVEEWLTRELLEIVPHACVIGEEAAHRSPDVLDRLVSDGPLWIIDPLDGTHNFANGHDGFGIMVAYAVHGDVRAAWVHLPVRDQCFVAGAGAGAFLNGARVRVPDGDDVEPPGGTFFSRYMPADIREPMLRRVDGRFRNAPHAGAAAVEYTDVLAGRKDFVAYYRLLPWDHGAPALILTEAGGVVEHLDGRRYSLRSANQVTVGARNARTAARVRGWLVGQDDA